MSHGNPSAPSEQNYEDWPINSAEEREYLGQIEPRTPVFYAPEMGRVFRGNVDEANRRLVPHDEHSWETDPGETVADLVERIEDEVGFESLSEFAEEHLESDD